VEGLVVVDRRGERVVSQGKVQAVVFPHLPLVVISPPEGSLVPIS
jgi:hypothetical protein